MLLCALFTKKSSALFTVTTKAHICVLLVETEMTLRSTTDILLHNVSRELLIQHNVNTQPPLLIVTVAELASICHHVIIL